MLVRWLVRSFALLPLLTHHQSITNTIPQTPPQDFLVSSTSSFGSLGLNSLAAPTPSPSASGGSHSGSGGSGGSGSGSHSRHFHFQVDQIMNGVGGLNVHPSHLSGSAAAAEGQRKQRGQVAMPMADAFGLQFHQSPPHVAGFEVEEGDGHHDF